LITLPDLDPRAGGTRFRLFPQPPFGGPVELETVAVSSPPGTIGPGPSDLRMYTIEPLGKGYPYGMNRGPFGTPFRASPPWRGPIVPPVLPDRAGHFDYLEPGMPGFEAAHVFGCIRFALDVWEGYFGRPVPWHFRRAFDRLEIVLLPPFGNAQTGFGYLEVGSYFAPSGGAVPFSLNFDIIAHEVGHLIIYSEIGQPTDLTAVGEYYGFHEAAADLVSIIAATHFDSVVDGLLANTRGNLYVLNRLNRIGEVSANSQIRLASNSVRLAAFAGGWRGEHELSLPLTGAAFDILVDVFHEGLLEGGLISAEVEDLADQVERRPEYQGLIQDLFDQAYADHPVAFKNAFLAARDYLGHALAHSFLRLTPHSLNYDDVAAVLLEADEVLSGGRYRRLIIRNFELRDIGLVTVGPRLVPPDASSHAFSSRTLPPEAGRSLPPMAYRERWELARLQAGQFDQKLRS
jgi:hypothetical protein